MSDMSVSSRDNQRSLEDLRAEQEAKLQKLRGEYQKRETQEREAGAAAISHIKKSTDERLDQLHTEGDERLKREADNINRSYSDLKRRATSQNEALEKDIGLARERAKTTINNTRDEQMKTVRQTQDQLQDFLERQRDVRSQARIEANNEVENTRRKAGQEVLQAKRRAGEQLTRIEGESKRAIEDSKQRNTELYNRTRSEGERRLTETRHDNEVKLEAERHEKNRSLNEIQRKYKDAAMNEERDGQRRLTDLMRKNQEKFEDNRNRALKLNEDVQTEYSLEGQRVQVQGESDIRERQAKFDLLRKQQATTNQARLKQLDEQLNNQEARTKKEAFARMEFENEKLDQGLKQLQSDFKKRYSANDSTFKDSLHNQKEGYLRELYKQKQRFDQRFGLENDRANDSFYRLKGFDAKLNEHPGAYEILAKVPPHEKDSVDIIVKDDKVILSAKRAYQDSFLDEGGTKTSTNSFQTYRQEFSLDIPVIASKAIRKVEDDGSITVIAPKRGRA